MGRPELRALDATARWPAYAQSKLANLLFMLELGRRAAAHGSDLVAVAGHPGYAATHLQTTSAQQTGGALLSRIVGAFVATGNQIVAQSDEAGARPQLYAATMPDVEPGDYFGPSGLFELRGDPERVDMTAAARDEAAAAELWTLSEELTGVTYTW